MLEFKLSKDLYMQWDDTSDIVIGNYDDAGEKIPRIYCSSLERAVIQLLRMPTVNQIQIDNIQKITESLAELEEKFYKINQDFHDKIEKHLLSNIDALQDEINSLKQNSPKPKTIKIKRKKA